VKRRTGKLLTVAMAASLLLSAMLLGACAAADPSAQFSERGCTVDLKKVCQYLIDQPEFTLNQEQFDHQRLENLSVRHVSMEVPWSVSGSMLTCMVDTQTARVTDAHIAEGPTLNDANITWVRANGLCR
jgi:hypothetical protein